MEKGHLPRTVYVFFAVVSILSIGLLQAPRARAAFGVSPPFLNADRLVKGSTFVQTIYLTQDQPNNDLPVETELDVPEKIRSWFSIDVGNNFVIPKGVRQFPMNVSVKVPKNADLAIYSGRLRITTKPGQAGQVSIALGAEIIINLKIGDEVYRKYSVPIIKPLDIEEGWNPLVYVKFNNEGNITEAFDGGTFELFDQFNATRLAYAQKGRDFPEVPPFTVKEFTVEFPTNFYLGIGQYWTNINFYQNDKVVASQKTVFNVVKRGTLSSPWKQFTNSLKRNWPYYLGGLGVIVLAGVAKKVVRGRGRRK